MRKPRNTLLYREAYNWLCPEILNFEFHERIYALIKAKPILAINLDRTMMLSHVKPSFEGRWRTTACLSCDERFCVQSTLPSQTE